MGTADSDKDSKSSELTIGPSCIQFRLIIVKVEKFQSLVSFFPLFASPTPAAWFHPLPPFPTAISSHSFLQVPTVLSPVHDFRLYNAEVSSFGSGSAIGEAGPKGDRKENRNRGESLIHTSDQRYGRFTINHSLRFCQSVHTLWSRTIKSRYSSTFVRSFLFFSSMNFGWRRRRIASWKNDRSEYDGDRQEEKFEDLRFHFLR